MTAAAQEDQIESESELPFIMLFVNTALETTLCLASFLPVLSANPRFEITRIWFSSFTNLYKAHHALLLLRLTSEIVKKNTAKWLVCCDKFF